MFEIRHRVYDPVKHELVKKRLLLPSLTLVETYIEKHLKQTRNVELYVEGQLIRNIPEFNAFCKGVKLGRLTERRMYEEFTNNGSAETH